VLLPVGKPYPVYLRNTEKTIDPLISLVDNQFIIP